MTTNTIETAQDWTNEFKVDDRGQVVGSRIGAARLAGVSQPAILKLLKTLEKGGITKSLSKPLQPFAGQAIEGYNQIPDLLISAIVAHYAFKGVEQAQQTLLAMNAIGMRTYLQQKLGWQQSKVELPQPTTTALLLPEIPKNKLAIKLVNDQALKTQLQHQHLFRQAYHELNYRFGYDIFHKKITSSKLERIEADGQLDNLILVMQNLWTQAQMLPILCIASFVLTLLLVGRLRLLP